MSIKYHALTIREDNGKTYWQLPHDTCNKAIDHAMKYRKNNGYILIFKADKGRLKELEYVYLNDGDDLGNTTWHGNIDK